jgi:hypothetical protein
MAIPAQLEAHLCAADKTLRVKPLRNALELGHHSAFADNSKAFISCNLEYHPTKQHRHTQTGRSSAAYKYWVIGQSLFLKGLGGLIHPYFKGVSVGLPGGGYRNPSIKLRLNGRPISKQGFDSSLTQINWIFDTL